MSPVLRAYGNKRIGDGERKLLYHKKELVYSSRARQRILRKISQHNVVDHVYAVHDEILKRDHDHHTKEGFIKIFIPREKCFSFHIISNLPQALFFKHFSAAVASILQKKIFFNFFQKKVNFC